ncbi:hypothetical protein AAGW05_09820 [Arthrobacter sp. LAPM80]|uniref:hypothetical protein n=1 Tax=Arthrobacter sp. LAPM80 TaxID=3141788 RepID=UPI00398A67DB
MNYAVSASFFRMAEESVSIRFQFSRKANLGGIRGSFCAKLDEFEALWGCFG